ncbi:MAG: hypothetical protein JWQ93_1207 [Marmoricola sp.]|nr:hypothetical protein [Marmoricola sp.]
MNDESQPIAYTALQPGTPVQTSDGHAFGSVETVLVVEEVSVFDGIVIRTGDGIRFVDADNVGAIFTSHVVTTLSAEEAANLPLPDQDPTYGVDATDDVGNSLADRFGRMFGRGKWKREK